MAGWQRWRQVLTTAGRLAAALALLLVMAAVGAAPAQACSCAATTPAESIERADVVLYGTVRDVDTASRPSPRHQRITVDVEAVYKGDAFAEQIVVSPMNDGACGIAAQQGQSLVIFAGYADREPSDAPELFTTLCFGNQVQSEAPTDLGTPMSPTPGRSADVGRAGRIDDMVSRGLMITGLTVLGVIAVAGLSLAVLWRPGRPDSH